MEESRVLGAFARILEDELRGSPLFRSPDAQNLFDRIVIIGSQCRLNQADAGIGRSSKIRTDHIQQPAIVDVEVDGNLQVGPVTLLETGGRKGVSTAVGGGSRHRK